MKRILAAWLISWSMATHRKLERDCTMGLIPTAADPTAAPMKPFSERGVSMTLSPNS